MKTGFVGLVGPTNSGKSTLMNALIGQKVSIVSPRVQTTYQPIKGILTRDDNQVVFSDTPGFQDFRSVIPRLLNKLADDEASQTDLLVWVFDVSNPRFFTQMERLEKKIRTFKAKEKTFCVLNKVDKIRRLDLLPIIDMVHKKDLFREIIPVSATRKENLEALLGVLKQELPEGERMYDADTLTDRPMSFLAAELVREQIYRATLQEVPYACRVEIEKWENPSEETKQRMPTIHAIIHVDSDSRKGILIGKKGEMLKRIGTYARKEIEKLTGSQVVLKLFVDLEKGWTEDTRKIETYLGTH